MSGEVISMKEWETALFVDWAVRLLVPMVMGLSEVDRQYILKRMERDFLNADGQ